MKLSGQVARFYQSEKITRLLTCEQNKLGKIHVILIHHQHDIFEFTPGFSRVRVARSLVFCLCFVDRCLSFFFWPLCCLSFDIRILITSLVSSNSSDARLLFSSIPFFMRNSDYQSVSTNKENNYVY